MWLKGQATQSTIVDRLTKLACGELADDVGNTVPLADRWIRHTVGQDFIVSPASEKVALPAMSMRAGYFQHSNGDQANSDLQNGNWVRLSSVCTAAPTGLSRWLLIVFCRISNTVAGNYSTSTWDWQIYNADTGAQQSAGSFTPNAAGVATITFTGGTCQVTVGNSETGLLRNNGNDSSNKPGWLVRGFSTAYMGGIDFWPMEYRRYPGESSTFTVAPPGVAGTDYDKDVRLVAGFQSGLVSGNRPRTMNVKGGWCYGLGIKTNTGLTGGLYTVSWNVYAMGLHLSLNGTQYIQAEINGGSGARADGGGRQRVQGMRVTQWLRMFTGAPLSSTPIQYWACVKANRIMVVLNGDPGTGGVLTVAGVWKFTPADPTYDLFPWAWSGGTFNYQADSGQVGAAFFPTRGIPYIAQLAAGTGLGLPPSRDWATGFMRTDCAMPTANGDSQSTTSNFDGTDDHGGTEGNSTATTFAALNTNSKQGGLAIGGVEGPGSSTYTYPCMGTIGMYGFAQSPNTNSEVEKGRPFPHTEAKPALGDTRWWLYGAAYTDSPSGTSQTPNATVKYRGKLTDKFQFVPSGGWSSGDEITDTVSGVTYFLVQADYAGNGLGRLRIGSNAWAVGIAIEEAA